MPTLEVHTLNQEIAVDMPQALVTRVGAIAAGGVAYELGIKAPETSGAFSFGGNLLPGDIINRSPAMSVIGEYMPPIESARRDFEALHDSELIGDLMRRARLSKLTGCIMPDLVRNHKGYTNTGIKAVKELGLGTTSRETHRVVYFARLAELTGRLPTDEEKAKEVDHICRNPACIYHTQLIDGDKNNALMAEARRIEPEIVAGQMFYITDILQDLPWLKYAIVEEGDRPAKVISTRLGPYALRLAHMNELVYGERVACEVYDSLKTLAKKPVNRKSRAKLRQSKPIPGHMNLFPNTKFKKKHISDIKEKYQTAEKLVS
jgi:hypothetical protein